MTHVHFPNFSQSLRPVTYDANRLPFHADPIFAAIDRHSEAWSVFQVVPEGEASETADAETFDSLHALLATPCATRTGMLCLIRHLRWWLSEEASNADAHRCQGSADAWAVAQVREAELSRCLGVEPVQRLPMALPSGRLIGPTIDLRPVPAPARLGRALVFAGELLAALVIIGGGCGLTGLASLL